MHLLKKPCHKNTKIWIFKKAKVNKNDTHFIIIFSFTHLNRQKFFLILYSWKKKKFYLGSFFCSSMVSPFRQILINFFENRILFFSYLALLILNLMWAFFLWQWIFVIFFIYLFNSLSAKRCLSFCYFYHIASTFLT